MKRFVGPLASMAVCNNTRVKCVEKYKLHERQHVTTNPLPLMNELPMSFKKHFRVTATGFYIGAVSRDERLWGVEKIFFPDFTPDEAYYESQCYSVAFFWELLQTQPGEIVCCERRNSMCDIKQCRHTPLSTEYNVFQCDVALIGKPAVFKSYMNVNSSTLYKVTQCQCSLKHNIH